MPTITIQGREVPVADGLIGQAPTDRAPPRPKHSWAELRRNIVPSAIDNATGLWDMVTHPRRTAEGIIDAAQGGVDRMMPEAVTDFFDTYVSPRSAETRERQRRVSGELIQALKDRYWGLENLKNTLITDPVGSALDAGGVAAGGLGLLRRPVTAMAKSRVNGLFNPKPKPQRPLFEDYPDGVELTEDGSIAMDIEGRPLDDRTSREGRRSWSRSRPDTARYPARRRDGHRRTRKQVFRRASLGRELWAARAWNLASRRGSRFWTACPEQTWTSQRLTRLGTS